MKNIKTSETRTDKSKKALLIQRIIAVCVCLAVGIAFLVCYIKYGKRLYEIFGNAESLKVFLAQFKGYDQWIFVAIRAFQTVIKIIPAEPLEIGSGVLYGTWGGLLFCMLGTEIGSLIIILLTKIFGRRVVDLFVPLEKIDSLKILQNKKRVYVSLFYLYLIPGTPKDVLTYVACLTKLDIPKFLLITGIARIPSILTSTLCGEQIIQKNYTVAIIIFVVTGVLGIVSSIIYKKVIDRKDKKALEEKNKTE